MDKKKKEAKLLPVRVVANKQIYYKSDLKPQGAKFTYMLAEGDKLPKCLSKLKKVAKKKVEVIDEEVEESSNDEAGSSEEEGSDEGSNEEEKTTDNQSLNLI